MNLKHARRQGRNALSDHYFMNAIRKAKAGTNHYIIQSDGSYIKLTVELGNVRDGGFNGEEIQTCRVEEIYHNQTTPAEFAEEYPCTFNEPAK